ncbi:MAG: hypothetical protein AAGF02_18180, partial [Actinomycetota bacterium]
FAERGAHSMTTTLEVADDILEDNIGSAAINVAGSLKVLLVDGHASNDFFDRGATFPAIALAPSRLTLNPNLEPNKPPESMATEDFYEFDPTLDPIQFLVEPKVIGSNEVGGFENFDDYDVVMLADVPRLPASTAEAIANFVEAGGGLFVAAGQRAIPDLVIVPDLDETVATGAAVQAAVAATGGSFDDVAEAWGLGAGSSTSPRADADGDAVRAAYAEARRMVG